MSAIISEIKKDYPNADIRFITDKRFFDFAVEKMDPLGVLVSKVSAGKFRRYSNLKWYDHIKHIFISYIPNLIDFFRFSLGIIQSFWKIIIFQPDVVFVKGGYVALPVGLAASWLGKPLVLHDSDAAPGLTNRILSKRAIKIGLGMPQENSCYDKEKTEYVGIPIDSRFKKASEQKKAKLREKYVGETNLPVVLVMGGSQGSVVINDAIIKSFPEIKGSTEVFLVTGKNNFAHVMSLVNKNKRQFIGLRVLPFISGDDNFELLTLSDIVITRAGATAIAELAAEQKAAIIVPSPYLASDHQSKNAELLQNENAAIVVCQDKLDTELVPKIKSLLDDEELRQKLGENLYKFSSTNAAEKMAKMIIEVTEIEK